MQWFDDKGFSKITKEAIEASLIAGNIIKKGHTKTFKVKKKQGIHNLVTEYDLLSEKTIIDHIKKVFPDHSFLSEEKGLEDKKSEIEWIIDPLDGTVNFAHFIPAFAVSIAAKKKNQIISGVIYYPLVQELFVAELNKGAYLNGKRLEVSKTKNLSDAFVSTGFPYDSRDNPNKCHERFLKVLKTGIPIRRIGVASIDLAYVAAGRFDLFWETGLSPWDLAAGILLIKEAHGKTSDYDGNKLIIKDKNALISSNGYIHDEFLQTIKI